MLAARGGRQVLDLGALEDVEGVAVEVDVAFGEVDGAGQVLTVLAQEGLDVGVGERQATGEDPFGAYDVDEDDCGGGCCVWSVGHGLMYDAGGAGRLYTG